MAVAIDDLALIAEATESPEWANRVVYPPLPWSCRRHVPSVFSHVRAPIPGPDGQGILIVPRPRCVRSSAPARLKWG